MASEDPFLNGEFGIEVTRNLEHPVAGNAYRSAISCTKHFAAYDCENCKPCDYKTMDSYFNYTSDPDQLYCDRQHFNALVSEQGKKGEEGRRERYYVCKLCRAQYVCVCVCVW